MTACPTISVIVCSWQRPQLLRRTLLGLWQQFYHPFEVVVVSDPDGLQAIRDLPFHAKIKTLTQEHPNISRARNQGVSVSNGRYCAFIDDDAVPEPHWLSELVGALDGGIDAVTGTVIGRNGFSVQWGRMALHRSGLNDLNLSEGEPVPPGYVPKLHGTNMMIDRDALVALGGFDEAFRFYLDESDFALRVCDVGGRITHTSRARVHHCFAPSSRRDAKRIPLDLFEIAASQAVFARKHEGDVTAIGEEFRGHQVERIKRKRITRSRDSVLDEVRLIESFDRGWEDGLTRPFGLSGFHKAHDLGFKALKTGPGEDMKRMHVPFGQFARVKATAAKLGAEGVPVHVVRLLPSPQKHTLKFTPEGFWLQSGGLFGSSDRAQPRFRYWRFSSRLAVEMASFGLNRAEPC